MARTVYTLVCQNSLCGKTFTSIKADRKYCCLRCHTSRPEFKAIARKNAVYAHNARKGTAVITERPCAYCGEIMHLNAMQVRDGKKFCTRDHYRKFMAKTFDRSIGASVTFKQMQGYDEFIMQDQLPCLIEGCEWTGDNLGLHLYQTHGITADDAKRMAGFNLGTGLVSPKLRATLEARQNAGNAHSLNQPKAVAARKFDYVSNERKEHAKKGAALALRDNKGRFTKK